MFPLHKRLISHFETMLTIKELRWLPLWLVDKHRAIFDAVQNASVRNLIHLTTIAPTAHKARDTTGLGFNHERLAAVGAAYFFHRAEVGRHVLPGLFHVVRNCVKRRLLTQGVSCYAHAVT